MRSSSAMDSKQAKLIARRKYAERQIDKYVKWSISVRGYLKYKNLVEQQNKYNIKVYG
jgi:hypothetical protein